MIKGVCLNNRATRLSGAGILKSGDHYWAGDPRGFLKSHIREDYATLPSTLDERYAIDFGRASSCPARPGVDSETGCESRN